MLFLAIPIVADVILPITATVLTTVAAHKQAKCRKRKR